MTQHQEFANILVDSSAKMLTCAKQIERGLQSVLDLADRCSPEIALLTADSLTALSQNVAGAPLIFAKKLRPTGVKMRHMVEILSHVLSHVKPQRVRSKEDMMRALRSTSSICEKFSVGQDVATLYRLLVYEIARVFFELRTALKKQAGGPRGACTKAWTRTSAAFGSRSCASPTTRSSSASACESCGSAAPLAA